MSFKLAPTQHRVMVFLFALTAGIACPVEAKSLSNKPLKIIASDLIIETAEQGEFLDDPADPRHFIKSNVAGKKCGLFGWRMKIKTTRKSILVQERETEGAWHAVPFRATPHYGYLNGGAPIVEGVPPGKYTSTIFVENVPVKTFTMIVK